MNPIPTVDERNTILEVVRGERPWTDLLALGIDIRFEDSRCTITNPRSVEATADVYDLARGVLAHQHDPQALRQWAYLMESGSAFLDLDVEQHPAGEVLLDALWNASFGEPVSPEAIRTARQLALVSNAQT